jgi:hypothetical protein
MIPGVKTWRSMIANTISMLQIQPSEFWRMDINELYFWYSIAKLKDEQLNNRVKTP